MFYLIHWLTIPDAVYGFISINTCATTSSAIRSRGCSSKKNHHLFVYRNGHFFQRHTDALLVVKHVSYHDSIGFSTPFDSAVVTCFNSLSSLSSDFHERRDKITTKISRAPPTTSSTGRDVSPSTTTTISDTIPYSWTAKSSTTQLYATRGGNKRRNASNKQAKNKESSTYFIEEDTYPNQEITASSKHNKQLNRKERMEILLSQHGNKCIWCNTPINISTATTDHMIPKIKGGPSWIENELANCYKCNKARGHIPALDYLEIKKEKGFFVNQDAIIQKIRVGYSD